MRPRRKGARYKQKLAPERHVHGALLELLVSRKGGFKVDEPNSRWRALVNRVPLFVGSTFYWEGSLRAV